jgi:chromosomal replication initiation ATPase DnaA
MTRPSAQLPLDLGFRPALGRDDFLIAPCNAEALAWLDRTASWPSPTTVLTGPSGSGKSHLLAVWAAAQGARMLRGQDLRVEGLDRVIGDALAVAVDGAEQAAEPDALFHLVNMMRERGGRLLLSAREAPARWRFGTPDLRSRLTAAPQAVLGAPDETLLGAVLLKQLDDRRVMPDPAVVRYLTERMPRSFAAAARLAALIDRMSLAERRKPSLPLARRALAELEREEADAGNGG